MLFDEIPCNNSSDIAIKVLLRKQDKRSICWQYTLKLIMHLFMSFWNKICSLKKFFKLVLEIDKPQKFITYLEIDINFSKIVISCLRYLKTRKSIKNLGIENFHDLNTFFYIDVFRYRRKRKSLLSILTYFN